MKIFLDALIDSLKILPFLFLIYLILEIIEDKYIEGFKRAKILKSNGAPLLGAASGLVPQCGFSVVATELYRKRAITMGTLIAVYIATSDEAVPILLAEPSAAVKLLPLLGIKFVFAIIAGYGIDIFFRFKYKNNVDIGGVANTADIEGMADTAGVSPAEETAQPERSIPSAQEGVQAAGNTAVADKKSRRTELLKRYAVNPLLHSLKIFIYIFIVNLILGFLLESIGEEVIAEFLSKNSFWQPFAAGLLGLIPNCASSVIISRLFATGVVGMGTAVSGLSANAGIAFAVLFREKAMIKENLFILCFLYLSSAFLGVIITLVWY